MKFLQTVSLVLSLFACPIAAAQDANFTQFYASPTYMNPAFAGAVPQYRATMQYRNQYPNIPNTYETNLFSFDYNLDYYNAGLGAMIVQDRLSSFSMTSTSLLLSYSYQINLTKKWIMRLGLQGAYTFRTTDFSRLVFQDQLDSGSPTKENLVGNFVHYPDVGTGFLVYNKTFWFGFGLHHLTRPYQSLINTSERLEMKQTVQAGAKFSFSKDWDKDISIAPAILYQRQGIFDQLDLGVNFFYEPLIAGIWYRGIPIMQNVSGKINQDAVAILAGFRHKNLLFTYSYDATISSLNRSGGAHEVALIFAPRYDKRNKRGSKHIDCPVTF
ncbi:MAG: type IX secretion system membrane protein PorP/SprF [Cytophagales bacterium]|nr:MAG: type IX secretion system membrane protein PorP/SprF [Cytophagales bacterium]